MGEPASVLHWISLRWDHQSSIAFGGSDLLFNRKNGRAGAPRCMKIILYRPQDFEASSRCRAYWGAPIPRTLVRVIAVSSLQYQGLPSAVCATRLPPEDWEIEKGEVALVCRRSTWPSATSDSATKAHKWKTKTFLNFKSLPSAPLHIPQHAHVPVNLIHQENKSKVSWACKLQIHSSSEYQGIHREGRTTYLTHCVCRRIKSLQHGASAQL